MSFTEEQKMIQDAVSRLAERELAPRAAQTDREGRFPREGLALLAEEGLFGMAVPQALGGSGADTVSFVLATEAVARACPSTALLFVVQRVTARAIALLGTDEQKQRHLPRLMSGAALGAFAVTEPGSGSNTLALSTRAKLDGEHLVLDGTKAMVSAAGEASLYVVVARADGAREPTELTGVLVEKSAPGLSVGSTEDFMGMRGVRNGELVFDQCRVPKSSALGPNHGWLRAAAAFGNHTLLGFSAVSVGIAQAALDAALVHARTREIGGKPLAQQPAIQHLLAASATRLAASRELLLAACREVDEGPSAPPLRSLMSKLDAGAMAEEVTRTALHIHGGTGYSHALPLERYHRDALFSSIQSPTTEFLRTAIAGMLTERAWT